MPFKNLAKFTTLLPVCPLPGIYGILDSFDNMIYIGQAEDIGVRIDQHMMDANHPMHRFNPSWFVYEFELLEEYRRKRESQLIREYRPLANRQHNGILPRDIFGWPSVFGLSYQIKSNSQEKKKKGLI